MSFIKTYKNIWPGLAVLFCLIVFRMYHTHTFAFGFLFWNLFLAILPLAFSYLTVRMRKPFYAWITAALWLVFFPNSAYLFTDIVHLSFNDGLLYWLDIMILVLSAVYGIVMGMVSLKQMELWYGKFLSPQMQSVVSFVLLLGCGYGIYLGRVERWNSWDVVAQPVDLLHTIAYHSRHPFRCKEVWMMSGLFGAGLYVLYLLFDRKQTLVQR
jgi:uncharacterized membrane protein